MCDFDKQIDVTTEWKHLWSSNNEQLLSVYHLFFKKEKLIKPKHIIAPICNAI